VARGALCARPYRGRGRRELSEAGRAGRRVAIVYSRRVTGWVGSVNQKPLGGGGLASIPRARSKSRAP